jgi:hypothetical protein
MCSGKTPGEKCDQESRVTPWEMFKMNVSNKLVVHQAQLRLKEEIKYGVGGEAIFDRVFVGDNLVVPCERQWKGILVVIL